MARSYTYSFRDLEKILRKNGYSYVRSNGSHKIFSNGSSMAVVPARLNKMLALRIMKQCCLMDQI